MKILRRPEVERRTAYGALRFTLPSLTVASQDQ